MSSPSLTRRALIAGAGTVIASAAMAIPYVNAARASDMCSLPVKIRHDPLAEAIANYRDGLASFEAYSRTDVTDEERDAFAEKSYQPPMGILDVWDRPATSHHGAVEALRLAAEENAQFGGSGMVGALLYAALAYFDPATA
ncbi:hypothetical protein [Devosia sp.]|uniref:hypothetical protein n=1 Tax=Devosia sp. TaxID=1871048 RepID=UPI001ACD5EF2|nr:hypothetical protein [Devosia sp.]MBN9333275.1 hypothetical protein [Devosia sp.]